MERMETVTMLLLTLQALASRFSGDFGGFMTRVLLVDDDRDFRDMLEETLRRRGYQVQSVCNGLKLMGALKIDAPDLLLIDVRMAWIDGIALTKSLKSNELYRHLPVIVMSACLDIGLTERALSAGAHSFVAKPFSLSVLDMRMREATGEMVEETERVLVSGRELERLRAGA